ncbi:MAG: CoA-binding protein [Symbiobacteriia bacterium]
MFQNPGDDALRQLLQKARTIAVIGLSPRPERDSYRVAKYLQDHAYRIIPVNPTVAEVLGEKSYPSLADVPDQVDVVNVFRRPEEVGPIVAEAIAKQAPVFWLQRGVTNEDAAGKAAAAGLATVMDRCIMVEHQRLLGG